MTSILLALALQSSDLLKPLVPVAQKIEKGLNEVLKGAAADAALKPWRVTAESGALESWQGVGSLTNVGFEFEIYFLKGDAAVYKLDTFVAFDGDKPFFVVFQGEETDAARGEPASAFAGEAAPFREAAEAIVKAARAKDASGIVFPDDEWFEGAVPAEVAEDGRAEVEESREGLEAALAAVAALDYDAIRIRVDDHIFIARDEGGKIVGTVKCEWKVGGEAVEFEIGEMEAFDK